MTMAKLVTDAPLVKWISAVLWAGICYVLPNDKIQSTAMAAFTLIMLDTLTGLWAAWKNGDQITSARFANVLSKIVGYGSVLIVCAIVAREMPGLAAMQAASVGAALGLIIATESISVLENARKIGVRLPFGLEEAILSRIGQIGNRREGDPPVDPAV